MESRHARTTHAAAHGNPPGGFRWGARTTAQKWIAEAARTPGRRGVIPTETLSSSGAAGRRHGRTMGNRSAHRPGFRDEPIAGRGGKNERAAFTNKLQFLGQQGELGFLLGLFPLGNGLAHLARMFAIESFDHGVGEGFGAQILSEHVGPRHRLEQRPMAARCRQQCDNQQEMAQAD
jgi:hypothetical protein